MNESKWYVLKVVSKQEQVVKSLLETELVKQKIEGCSIEVPCEKVYEMRSGKKKIKDRSLFPGYVLIYANLLNSRFIQAVRNTPGALGFLSTKGWGLAKEPVPLRKNEVDKFLGRIDNETENIGLKQENQFVVSEMVTIIEGPFNGFSGKIQTVFKERKKLNVSVNIFGRSTPVELSYTEVKKLF